MKKTLIAVAALSTVAASAMAANVTIYGKIDQGLQFQQIKGTQFYPQQRKTVDVDKKTFKATSGISSGSRWGIKGTEEITDGYKVGFVLESGFDGTDGTIGQGGKLFGRDSFLTLDTPFGTFTAGRTGMLSDGCTGDIISGHSSPFGTTYGIAAATANTFSSMFGGRTDRAIRYVSPKFAGVQVHAEYANMNGGSTQSTKRRYGGFGLSYANGPLYVAAAAETVRWAVSDEEALTNGHSHNPVFLSLAGNYDFGAAKVYFGYQHGRHAPVSMDQTGANKSEFGVVRVVSYGEIEYDMPFIGKYNAATLGVSSPIGNGAFMASVAYRKGTHDYNSDLKVKWMTGAIGYKYNLSKRTYLYTDLAYGKEEWKGDGNKANSKVTQFNLGLCHDF